MTHTFQCGHPMDTDNAVIRSDGYKYCRTCRSARRREKYAENPEVNLTKQRRQVLPGRIARARARLAKLEAEAISLGLTLENDQ